MQYLGYLAFRLVILLFWIIPFPVLYFFSDGLAFLLFRVIGYRKEIVISNLKKCFPEKEESEILSIAAKSYKNLSDIILETLKSFSMPIAQLRKRFKHTNPEILNEYSDKGIPIMLSGSHYNNWEWGAQTIGFELTGKSFGVYKPLKNKPINDYASKIRSRAGVTLIAMRDVFPFIKKNSKVPGVYLFLSDQIPSFGSRVHWIDFMGIETAAFTGVDTLARLYNFPVFHFKIKRVKRGYYELTFEPACLDPQSAAEGEIIQTLMSKLADTLREKPENWLWSHKRWKYNRQDLEKLRERRRQGTKAKP